MTRFLEALAFGSLMLEGVDIRMSGQDVGRGTFSHRHGVLVNQKTEEVIIPLNDELKAERTFELANSSPSEMAVLGVRIPPLVHDDAATDIALQSLNMALVGKDLICYLFGRHR
jgi:2-oxoglutarate dehydrogenase complex dehydrogenase (E1) component-like enzyme